MLLFPFYLLFILNLNIDAQSIQFNDQDSIYFERQIPRYSKWLKHRGFGNLLEAYEIDTDSNQVTLVLKSKLVDADSTLWAWNKLEHSYALKNAASIEERLFSRFCQLMEVPDSMAVIEIYNAIGPGLVPCFYRGIYFDQGRLKTISDYCMNKHSIVEIEDFKLRPEIKQGSSTLESVPKEKLTEFNLQKEIRSFLIDYFQKEKNAEIDFLNPRGSLLLCEVKNIRREVLSDEANPVLAKFLNLFGYELDWVKREFLTIEVFVQLEEDKTIITIDLNGKYGSGFHTPRRNAYLDMEPEFEDYIANYASKMAEKIKLYLTLDK